MTDETEKTDAENVVMFPGAEEASWVDIKYIREDDQICPADDVLKAQIGELKNVILLGQVKETGGFIMASSLSHVSDINMLIDCLKNHMTRLPLE